MSHCKIRIIKSESLTSSGFEQVRPSLRRSLAESRENENPDRINNYCEIRLYRDLGIGSVVFFNRTGMPDERFLDKADKIYFENN